MRGWMVMVLGLCLTGCGGWLVAFNECDPDQGDVLGRTTVELDLRKTTVRAAEAPVGNLVVDAMFDAARAWCVPGDASRPCPVAAVENAGGIRTSTSCGERESIPIGTIHQSDVDDMLPFATNQLVVVELTGEELLLMLERSVSILGQVGESGAGGFFLQVHNLRFEIDCAQPPQVLDSKNEQIQQAGSRVRADRVTVDGLPLQPTAVYPVAMNSFIAGARDGFLALAERDGSGRVIRDTDGSIRTKAVRFVELDGARISEADAVRRYIQGREGRVVAPRVEGRIVVQQSCIPTE